MVGFTIKTPTENNSTKPVAVLCQVLSKALPLGLAPSSLVGLTAPIACCFSFLALLFYSSETNEEPGEVASTRSSSWHLEGRRNTDLRPA